jgi:hypothetical protein
MNILAYNLFYGEKEEQIKFINEHDFDIIFLSEASSNVINNFNNYNGDLIESHCGYTYLGINKKHNVDILMIIKLFGCVVFHVKINNEELILGSLHLFPYKAYIKKRKELQYLKKIGRRPKCVPIDVHYGCETYYQSTLPF